MTTDRDLALSFILELTGEDRPKYAPLLDEHPQPSANLNKLISNEPRNCLYV